MDMLFEGVFSEANLDNGLKSAFFGKILSRMPSTVIRHFTYDRLSQTLQIKFVSGITYEYKNVPEEIYFQMKTAWSKGVYFNNHIKDKYEFEKRTA